MLHIIFHPQDLLNPDRGPRGAGRMDSGNVRVLSTSHHVKALVDGRLVAKTRRPLLLLEGRLPPRWYFPPDDVRKEVLTPSGTRTRCPHKGEALYFSARLDRRTLTDAAWTYAEPLPEAAAIKRYLAFDEDRVELEVDGAPVRRRPL